MNTELLKEQIKAVHEARWEVTSARRFLDMRRAAWEADHSGLIERVRLLLAAQGTAEEKLREMTLEAYAETSSKMPAPGVTVKIFQVLDYDPDKAKSWALEHHLALKLDVPAFEKIAKIENLPFVAITEEPRAQIATNLEAPIYN